LKPPADGDFGENRDCLTALLENSLIFEIEVADPRLSWRYVGDRPIGLVITDSGRACVALFEQEVEREPSPASKIGRLIELLKRTEGASLKEMSVATGWQLHSVRAALTRLRQKGLDVVRVGTAPEPRYHIRERF
jgi:hypothetical protein